MPAMAGPGVANVLQSVGLTAEQEQVYRTLLAHPGATQQEILSRLPLSRGRLREVLGVLQRRGLVSRARRSAVAGYFPASPDVSIAALVRQRTEELEALSEVAVRLGKEFRQAGGGARRFELLEMVEGPSAVTQRFVQLQQAAQREVLVLDRPPYATHPDGDNPAGISALGRGVHYRAIYDAGAVAVPGGLARIERHVTAGEVVRVFNELPLKLTVVDRQLALLPLDVRDPTTEAALIRSPTLLTGLTTLFDALWERALPWSAVQEADATPKRHAFDDEEVRLLGLLATGLKDEAIARQLGISLRTFRRRVATLTAALDAGSRFQLALKAAKTGLL